nr:N,N-dimethylformamidase beta subunit family domain-containing protein [Sphingomonas sp. Y57]
MSGAPLIGYGDRFEVAPGESLGFHVSAPAGGFGARLVRLARRAGDLVPVASAIDGHHEGGEQPIVTGSHMGVAAGVPLPARPAISLWFRPTRPGDGRDQALLGWGRSHGLLLDGEGRLRLRWGDAEIVAGQPCATARWTEARVETRGDRIALTIRTADAGVTDWSGEVPLPGIDMRINPQDFHIAAFIERNVPVACFDGKLARPRIGDGEVLLAAWNLAEDPGGPIVLDEGPAGRHGRLFQTPQRGVTGPGWNGLSGGWSEDPAGYDAIAFHSDDLTDAGWPGSFSFKPPADLPSDAYGIELSQGGQRDVVPFFVLPAPDAEPAPLAFLVPTFSYLAYANERHWWSNPGVEAIAGAPLDAIVAPIERWAEAVGLISAYDYHRDGSGCAHASLRRPLVNMRADYRHPLLRGPHQLGADIATIEWLRATGQRFDVITDHVLHERGVEALKPYRAVMTGSHPEYVSGALFDAVEAYVGDGGRLIHLGGNAFYFVTSIFAEEPHVIEVRRGHAGTIPWQSPPGECRQAATGEPGGLWRWRGRSAHRLLGTGTAAVSFGEGRPYVRDPASQDPAFAWIFEGVDPAVIDARAELLGGPSGFEVDAMRADLGTPSDTVRLATATGFDPALTFIASEDVLSTGTAGAMESHIAYRRLAGGGRVFSAPSIAWTSCLADRGGDNDVARITANVIRAFTRPEGPPDLLTSRGDVP